MRARVLFLATLTMMAGAACRAAAPVLLRVEMPGVSPFPAGSFAEIIVTDFRNGTPLPDFDAGLELQTYLAAELRRAFDGAVSLRSLPAGPGIPPETRREAAAGRNRAVILTGTVRFGSQVRKAVVDKRVPFDSPFDLAGRALIEQLRWTLLVDVAVISGDNRETLYRQTFREDRDYIDLEKPADFAFSDCSAGFRERLFPVLLGSPTVEERTLLRR
ncbi:MAG: hypothetical protein ACXW2O_01160 [Candidatus Aminicenantales bacterium]